MLGEQFQRVPFKKVKSICQSWFDAEALSLKASAVCITTEAGPAHLGDVWSAVIREARVLFVLGLPMIGSHFAQISMQITDTVMLAKYSPEALAAVVLGTASFLTLFLVGSGFAAAVMSMVAAASSNGNDAEVRHITRSGLWLSFCFSVIVMPGFWFSEPLFIGLGQDENLAKAAQSYLRIAGWGMFPALLVVVLKNYLAAQERTQFFLWITITAAVLNGLLNWALIFGQCGAPELGILGAAFATIAAQCLTLICISGYAAWRPELRRHMLFLSLWRVDRDSIVSVFRIGYPIGLTSLAESCLFAASAFMMGWVGTFELAAHGITLQIVSAIFMFHLGMSNAATVRSGQAYGQEDIQSLRLVTVTAFLLVLSVALLTIILFLTIPELIIGLFVSTQSPEGAKIVAVGSSILAVAALFQLADAGQAMTLALLRGIQDTRVPMVNASFSFLLVGVPASYLLGFVVGLGSTGIWFGLVTGLTLAFSLLSIRFWRICAECGTRWGVLVWPAPLN